VLANDSDPDGDPLTITGASAPAHGTAVASATNITYTPAAGFLGTDSFTYSISDGRGGVASARVTVNVVQGADTAPETMDDTITTVQGTAATAAVLANDFDPDGDALTLTSVTPGSNGTATANADGTITYSPNPGFVGPDAFTYTVADGRGGTATARVNVTVWASAPPAGTETAGDGSIADGNGGRNVFDFEANSLQGAPGGDIGYRSDFAGIDLKGSVEVLKISGSIADFSGPCTLGKKRTPCRYAAHVEDHGKPGAGVDRFQIQVTNAQGKVLHQANGLLLTGDIRFGSQ